MGNLLYFKLQSYYVFPQIEKTTRTSLEALEARNAPQIPIVYKWQEL